MRRSESSLPPKYKNRPTKLATQTRQNVRPKVAVTGLRTIRRIGGRRVAFTRNGREWIAQMGCERIVRGLVMGKWRTFSVGKLKERRAELYLHRLQQLAAENSHLPPLLQAWVRSLPARSQKTLRAAGLLPAGEAR